MKATILSMALIAVAACGGASVTGNPNPGQTTCTYTYSGALTGTFSGSCVGGVAAYDSTKNIGALTFATIASNYTVSGAIEITSTGGISNKTYSLTDSSAQGALVIISGSQEWEANTATSGNPAVGAMSINVTSSNSYATANGVTGYYIHGTADATLAAVAGSGATGTVTLHAVF
jgi:hypothetical protein